MRPAAAALLTALALGRLFAAQDEPGPQADGFAWDQRAWALLAEGREEDAAAAFLKAIDRSTATASQAEANLGLGIAALQSSRPKDAMPALRSALVQGPYILPAAAYQTALTALALGDGKAALAFLRQSVDLDPMSLEPLRELARLCESLGDKTAAWRAYDRLAGFAPGDSEALARREKLSRSFKKGQGPVAPLRRLIHPLLPAGGRGSAELETSTAALRVGLFSDGQGRQSGVSKIAFQTNSPFQIFDAAGAAFKEEAETAAPWKIAFRAQERTVEVRDGENNIRYAAKGPFRVVPSGRQGSVLVQNAQLLSAAGVDAGDREMRGSLEVVPEGEGFKLVDETRLEDYVYGALGAALPAGSPAEAYKAMAVVLRTGALWRQGRARAGDLGDICDSSFCQRYVGVNDEMREASRAVEATAGEVLAGGGRPAGVRWHENCGGLTEEGVSDSPQEAPDLGTPEKLERWTHGSPPEKTYCALPAVEARWVRILRAEDLKARAERLKPIGDVVALGAARRSAAGRVLALEVTGSRGSFTLEGEKAIADFLSPGSLRSTFFTVRPLKKGFILWGAGTGDGRGLCAAGAAGQAALGWTYDKILAHYFPELKLSKRTEPR